MKRYRLDQKVWNFGDSPYYQMRVDIKDFSGVVGLLELNCGNLLVRNGDCQYWERPKAGKFPICGKGMKWLMLAPDDKEHILTVMYQENGKMSVCYIDMIEKKDYDKDGVLVYIDKYLDVDFTPEGDVLISDRDELDDAYDSGELTDKQYSDALKECDRVLEQYCSDIGKTVAVFNKILFYVNEKIANTEKEFKDKTN